jgi:hypothetical protein
MEQRRKTSRKTLIALDFDGVLAQPYTHPEKPYPQVPTLIEELAEKHLLCVVSYNPRAALAIEAWGLSKHFVAVRAGSNSVWKDYCPEQRREGMTKSKQIMDIATREIRLYWDVDEVHFFDDDPKNLEAFRKDPPTTACKTLLIDSYYGLRMEDVERIKKTKFH